MKLPHVRSFCGAMLCPECFTGQPVLEHIMSLSPVAVAAQPPGTNIVFESSSPVLVINLAAFFWIFCNLSFEKLVPHINFTVNL